MNAKQLVYDTLSFTNTGRAPRQLWTLPWAREHHPEALARIEADFPTDIIGCPGFLPGPSPVAHGDPYDIGVSVDAWGCVFHNLQRGCIGEVKTPLVVDDEWADAGRVHIPVESLRVDVAKVNAYCAENKDRFIMAGCCPRPFEQLQFIRGTEPLYVDLMLRPDGLMDFIRKMHAFYCEEMLVWAKTDVDALQFMDDWGAQRSLLISPALWAELFMPLYHDYISIAHDHGKKIFMHSDGYILDIIPHLAALGLDAVNAQLFCMGVESLAPWRGRITFWGEMDRQHLLPNGTQEDIRAAVRQVKEHLWQDGGCIAQCEFGLGAKPENVYAMFDEWDRITAGAK